MNTVLAQVATTISDPMNNSITNLSSLFAFALNLILGVGFALVLIMLAMGFVQYIMSQGDKAGVEKAQKWVTYAVVGGIGLFLVFTLRQLMFQLTNANNFATAVGNGVTL